MVRLILFLMLGALTAPGVQAQTGATPPDWFSAHIEYLTRDGGRWVADNADYVSEAETHAEYVVEFRSQFGATSASGRLFARTDGAETVDFWAYRFVFDPREDAVRLEQFGWGGAYGSGPMRLHDEDSFETEQVFISPGGEAAVMMHLFEVIDDDRHETVSWTRGPDGERLNERRYVWVREPVENR